MSGYAPGVARLHAWSIGFALLCAVPPAVAFALDPFTSMQAAALITAQAVLLAVAIAFSVAAWRRQTRAIHPTK